MSLPEMPKGSFIYICAHARNPDCQQMHAHLCSLSTWGWGDICFQSIFAVTKFTHFTNRHAMANEEGSV